MTIAITRKLATIASTPVPNLAVAREFLKFLDPNETAFTVQVAGDTDDAKARAKAGWRHGPLDKLMPWLVKKNEQGCGVFVMVNKGDGKGRRTQHVQKVRAVFIDLDGPSLDPVMASQMPPHRVVETSPGHFHCYWQVHDCSLDRFSATQEALAAKFGGDTVKDLPRVMRLPGFVHRKATPFLVRIVT